MVVVVIVIVTARAPPPQRLYRHEQAGRRDRAVARIAHGRHLGRRAAEALAQQIVGQHDDRDRRHHVHGRDLSAHQDAAADAGVAREEIACDHELAVARPERVKNAISEGQCEGGEERGADALAIANGAQPLRHRPVGRALNVEHGASDCSERAESGGRLFGRSRGCRGRRLGAGERIGLRARNRDAEPHRHHHQCGRCQPPHLAHARKINVVGTMPM